jgi:hypothetical protein
VTLDSDYLRLMRPCRWALLVLLAVGSCAVLAATAHPASGAERPLQTAIVDPAVFGGPNADEGLTRAVDAGATAIKVPLFWNGVAPFRRPRGFEPARPSDPAYNWAGLDAQLELIRSYGLEPIVYIAGAPTWALRKIDGYARPDPAQFAAFALAAVRRYSGRYHGLPRVRYWQAWNEPNKVAKPGQKAGAEAWYRTLVNGFAVRVHSVPGNEVIAGGVSPFGISTAVAPLTFMRDLLCVSPGPEPRPTCATRVHFDIWSVDPYTAGGPSHPTAKADDISVAELPEMKSVLDAAVRLGHVASTRSVRFWVTEFAWDSNPPDPGGVPAALEGRWVADALHRMWLSGVSLVTWFTLRDQPLRTSPYQSGLYYLGSSFASDRPKPALTAFRFPFVASPDGKRISVWGRTPTSSPGRIRIEQHQASSWATVGLLQADRVGIFTGTVRSRGVGLLRAVVAATGDASLPYSLVSPPDQAYQPFGAQLSNRTSAPSSNAAVSQYVEDEPTAGGGAGLAAPAVLPAVGTDASRAAPGSALAAVGDAIVRADRKRAVALGGALVAATLALIVLAVRRRRPQQLRTKGGLHPR